MCHQETDTQVDQAVRPRFRGTPDDEPGRRREQKRVVGDEKVGLVLGDGGDDLFGDLMTYRHRFDVGFRVAELNPDRIPRRGLFRLGPLGQCPGDVGDGAHRPRDYGAA